MILHNFIVFEGIDGSGTTTQLEMLKEYFSSKGKCPLSSNEPFFTQEPTDNEIGKLIRKALGGKEPFTSDTMARLFAADRCEHLFGRNGIVEAANCGRLVFSDRYLFSGIAYQTIAGAEKSAKKHNEDFPLPEILFFFDLPVHVAMQRISKRKGEPEIYEKADFQEKVREEYSKVIRFYEKAEPAMKVIRINAEEDISEIHKQILFRIENMRKRI